MRKRNINKLFIPFISLSLLCSSCSLPFGDVKKFVGKYRVSFNYKRKYHYYWGKSTLKEETTVSGIYGIYIINEDKSVTHIIGNNEEETGSVWVYDDGVKFKGLSVDSSLKFVLIYDENKRVLEYSLYENKVGLEYDYYSIRVGLTEVLDV